MGHSAKWPANSFELIWKRDGLRSSIRGCGHRTTPQLDCGFLPPNLPLCSPSATLKPDVLGVGGGQQPSRCMRVTDVKRKKQEKKEICQKYLQRIGKTLRTRFSGEHYRRVAPLALLTGMQRTNRLFDHVGNKPTQDKQNFFMLNQLQTNKEKERISLLLRYRRGTRIDQASCGISCPML